jgi:hypothetical protein
VGVGSGGGAGAGSSGGAGLGTTALVSLINGLLVELSHEIMVFHYPFCRFDLLFFDEMSLESKELVTGTPINLSP